MSLQKTVYRKHYHKLVRALPMDDALFIAKLYSKKFLPGDALYCIEARRSRAGKAEFFLENYVAKGFDESGENKLFSELLDLLNDSDDSVLRMVAANISRELSMYL